MLSLMAKVSPQQRLRESGFSRGVFVQIAVRCDQSAGAIIQTALSTHRHGRHIFDCLLTISMAGLMVVWSSKHLVPTRQLRRHRQAVFNRVRLRMDQIIDALGSPETGMNELFRALRGCGNGTFFSDNPAIAPDAHPALEIDRQVIASSQSCVMNRTSSRVIVALLESICF